MVSWREELGGLGIIAGIVAPIGLGKRPPGIERSGLGAGEGGGIAGAGGGDRQFALDLAIDDHAAQAELERAVIAAQPLGDIDDIRPAPGIDAPGDVAVIEPARPGLDGADILDLGGGGGLAGDAIGAQRRQAGERVAVARAQRIDLADRRGGIAADDRIAAIEHVGQRRAGHHRLRGAQQPAARADAEGVAEAERLGICRRDLDEQAQGGRRRETEAAQPIHRRRPHRSRRHRRDRSPTRCCLRRWSPAPR